MITNGPMVIKPWNGASTTTSIVIAAGATGESEIYRLIDLTDFAAEYQVACTGVPNVELTIEQSTDGVNFYTPDNFADLNPSITDKLLHALKIAPIPVQYFRFKATEKTTTVADTVVSLRLSVQRRFGA